MAQLSPSLYYYFITSILLLYPLPPSLQCYHTSLMMMLLQNGVWLAGCPSLIINRLDFSRNQKFFIYRVSEEKKNSTLQFIGDKENNYNKYVTTDMQRVSKFKFVSNGHMKYIFAQLVLIWRSKCQILQEKIFLRPYLPHCNIAILQQCNIATLQLCNIATLQHCDTATLRHCKITTMQH